MTPWADEVENQRAQKNAEQQAHLAALRCAVTVAERAVIDTVMDEDAAARGAWVRLVHESAVALGVARRVLARALAELGHR